MMPTSKELREMADREWKNREERKGIHDKVSWTSGWISGYLTRNPQAEILDSLCNIDLTRYVWGELNGEDVGQCRGTSCNYCGRYNEELREGKEDE